MSNCPNCGTSVQTDATFCGQCGFDLRAEAKASGEGNASPSSEPLPPTVISGQGVAPTVAMPPLNSPEPLVEPAPVVGVEIPEPTPEPAPEPIPAPIPTPEPTSAPAVNTSKTQLQQVNAKLLHVQTNTLMELQPSLTVIHIGKPNDRVPPDIDVSGFPNSEIVSRIHADVRVEGDGYYIEDVGSANGTYVNNFPLPAGNRHRLRPGDRIALGKGDLVTFLFQMS
jgi:pSer/pThr/pTyr-binding forkhead associated (FHA) protein